MKRTLKRELKVLEIAKREALKLVIARSVNRLYAADLKSCLRLSWATWLIAYLDKAVGSGL